MPIPDLISFDHIRRAADEIRKSGVPKRRGSRDYDAIIDGHRFPPKYLISVACRIATGHALRPKVFNGGKETNEFLRKRRVQIIDKEGNPVTDP